MRFEMAIRWFRMSAFSSKFNSIECCALCGDDYCATIERSIRMRSSRSSVCGMVSFRWFSASKRRLIIRSWGGKGCDEWFEGATKVLLSGWLPAQLTRTCVIVLQTKQISIAAIPDNHNIQFRRTKWKYRNGTDKRRHLAGRFHSCCKRWIIIGFANLNVNAKYKTACDLVLRFWLIGYLCENEWFALFGKQPGFEANTMKAIGIWKRTNRKIGQIPLVNESIVPHTHRRSLGWTQYPCDTINSPAHHRQKWF